MVTEERSIENEWQVQKPTNYDQHIKIQNTKPKPRAEKNQIQQYTNHGSKL